MSGAKERRGRRPHETETANGPLADLTHMAGVRMEDALHWQEQWIHSETYGFPPHRGAIDAAMVLTRLVELAQALKTPLVGAGTDYTKCFDLIPQVILMALMEKQGMDEGVLRALSGM